jgi:hypothetical protein
MCWYIAAEYLPVQFLLVAIHHEYNFTILRKSGIRGYTFLGDGMEQSGR